MTTTHDNHNESCTESCTVPHEQFEAELQQLLREIIETKKRNTKIKKKIAELHRRLNEAKRKQ